MRPRSSSRRRCSWLSAPWDGGIEGVVEEAAGGKWMPGTMVRRSRVLLEVFFLHDTFIRVRYGRGGLASSIFQDVFPEWSDLPEALRKHLLLLAAERRISGDALLKLQAWRESEPKAPEGPCYKDFGSFKRGKAVFEDHPPPRANCQGEAALTSRTALALWKHDQDAWRGESARRRRLSAEPTAQKAVGPERSRKAAESKGAPPSRNTSKASSWASSE